MFVQPLHDMPPDETEPPSVQDWLQAWLEPENWISYPHLLPLWTLKKLLTVQWHGLCHYGIGRKFPRPTKIHIIICRSTEYFVWINDTISEPIPVTSGVKQGCLFPQLFQPLHQCPNCEYKEAWLRSEVWWIDPSPPQVCWWRCPHGWNKKGPPVYAQCTSLLVWILAIPHQYWQSKICLLQIKVPA